mgnify:CR=1 FL=1
MQIKVYKKFSIKNYWDIYYKKEKFQKESNFAKYIFSKYLKKKIKKNSFKFNLIDIGCGDGRDSFFFNKKKIITTGIDFSNSAIKNNLKRSKGRKNLKFFKIDIRKSKIDKKFDLIYLRFVLHAINLKTQAKLFRLINKIAKKNSLIFFEFRTNKDPIFKKGLVLNKNDHFTNHYRRIIEPKIFKKNFMKISNFKTIFFKVSNKFSIKGSDKPFICRMVFRKLN